ncbi:MAG: hypothetical protein PUI72_01595 [Prevotellaceae bacterium]|nr:hypothetical protein [Prevotellaceae bacterium]MDY6198845.1 hypothetical protein [Prevotella sp.]
MKETTPVSLFIVANGFSEIEYTKLAPSISLPLASFRVAVGEVKLLS